ncbi:MAG: rod shape-determining protein [Candidatus Dormibacteraeota bacterium]|nr:rod shape-determining protein [Candidatus Dormibacteraeota bacterium]
MLGKKLGVDLGTATTRVITRGEGTVLTEPTVVAIREGEPVLSLMGSSAIDAAAADSTLELRRPLQGGNIVDRRALTALVQHAVNRAAGRQRIFKPDLVIAVRSGMSGEDRRTVLEAAARAGSRTVYLIDAVIAAAMGAGVAVTSPRASMVIDIGAGKTDVAVLALEGTIAGRSLSIGSEALTDRLAGHLHAVHGVSLGRDELRRAGRLLVAASHEERTAEIGGVLMSSHELAPLVTEHLRTLDRALLEVLDETPPALRQDVKHAGLLLTGGGARLEGLERHLGVGSGCSARVASEPDECTVRGTALAVDNLDVLRRNFMYIR